MWFSMQCLQNGPKPHMLSWYVVELLPVTDPSRLTDEQKLLAKLRLDYDRYTRPVMNASHVVTVTLGITLNQVFDVVSRSTSLCHQLGFYKSGIGRVPDGGDF